MVDLNEIAVFVKVVQMGSFSRAAHSLGLPVSTVSRRVSALEAQLGVILLQRTTRKLNLTAQGRDYFDQCNEPLSHLYEAEKVLRHVQKQPEGLLKLSAPMVLGQSVFFDFVSDFLKQYPSIRIELFITNIFLDLIADNIDLAIRFGEIRDASIVAKRLGTSVRYLVATPGYLDGRSLPQTPEDLREHQCVLMAARNNETDWQLVSGRRKVTVRVSGPVSSRDFLGASAFTERGHGIGLLPSTYCEAGLARGRLVRILPRWSSPEIAVHAVYPTRKFLPTRLRVFLEALKEWQSPLWTPSSQPDR